MWTNSQRADMIQFQRGAILEDESKMTRSTSTPQHATPYLYQCKARAPVCGRLLGAVPNFRRIDNVLHLRDERGCAVRREARRLY